MHLTRIARAIADLGCSTISQKRWSAEVRKRLDKQKRAPGETLEEIKRAGGCRPKNSIECSMTERAQPLHPVGVLALPKIPEHRV